jgi:hypothetical protein
MTTQEKIDQIIEWYAAQFSGDIRLFKGEANEMTKDNIYAKINHYTQLGRLEKHSRLRPHHSLQIDRAYRMNVECWPLERITQRYLKSQEKAA